MLKKNYDFIRIACILALLFCSCSSVNAQDVADQYKKYFVKFEDKRSMVEKILNLAGLSNEDVGRSFALICSISEYPKMGALDRTLPPAAEDAHKMKNYLQQNEFFDEIVVLENSNVTLENLRYFLQTYFPARLKEFPKSRFLFAYSGHGMTENNKGYLLESTAESLSDKAHAINLDELRVYINEVVSVGHQVLVLLNSCYGGSFLKRSYGNKTLIPNYPGAHAITAGGVKEPTWHDPALGKGSVFYEKIIAGLAGLADTSPKDGIITAHELAVYLRNEIRVFSDQQQNPQLGDISVNGSAGEFFFLNKEKPPIPKAGEKFNPSISMGGTPPGNDNYDDKHDWEILSKKGVEGLRSYLLLHPNGKWADEARDRTARLQPKPEPQPPSSPATVKRTLPKAEQDRLESEWQREQHANSSAAVKRTVSKEEQDQIDYEWQDIQGAATSHTIELFLERYPVGSHVSAAQRKLEELRARGR